MKTDNVNTGGGGGGSSITSLLNLTSGIAGDKNAKVTLESNAKLGLALDSLFSGEFSAWNDSQPQIVFLMRTTTNKLVVVAKDSNSTNSVNYAVYDSDYTQLRAFNNIYGNIHQGSRPLRFYHIPGTDRFLMSGEPNSGSMGIHLFQFNDVNDTVSRSDFESLETSQGSSSNNLCDFAIDTTRDLVVGIGSAGASNTPLRVKTFSGYAAGSLTQEGTNQDYNSINVNQRQVHQCAYDPISDAVYLVVSQNSTNDARLECMKFTHDGTQYVKSGSSVDNSTGSNTINSLDDNIFVKDAFCSNSRFVFKFNTTNNARIQINALSVTGGTMGTSFAQVVTTPHNMNNGEYRIDLLNIGNEIYTTIVDSVNEDNNKIYKDLVTTLGSLFSTGETAKLPVNYNSSSLRNISIIPIANSSNVALVYLNTSPSSDNVGIMIYSAIEAFFSLGDPIGVLKDVATIDNGVDVILDAKLQGILIDQDNTNNTIGKFLEDGSLPISTTQTLKPIGNRTGRTKPSIYTPAAGSSSTQTGYLLGSFAGQGKLKEITLMNDSNSGSVNISRLYAVRDGIEIDFTQSSNWGLILVANSSTGMSNHVTLSTELEFDDGLEVRANFTVSNGFLSSVVMAEVPE